MRSRRTTLPLLLGIWAISGCGRMDAPGTEAPGERADAGTGDHVVGHVSEIRLAPRRGSFVVDSDGFTGRGNGFASRYSRHGLELALDDSDDPSTFSLRIEGIGRGAAPPPSNSGTPVLDADARVRLERGSNTEFVEWIDGELMQSWRFDRMPEGEGDLVVRLVFEGGTLIELNESGAHFTVPGSELGLRYSHATWIDANGEERRVTLGEVPGGLEIRVPASLVENSVYPVVLDPILGAETAVDSPVASYSAGYDEFPALAWGPSTGLVVWTTLVLGGRSLRAMRVAGDGRPLDSASFPLRTTGRPTHVAVARGPAGWLVVWTEEPSVGSKDDVFGCLVADDGTPGPAFPIRQDSLQTAFYPQVAYDGTNYFVVWGEATSLMGTRIDAAGVVLDPPATLATNLSTLSPVGLAHGGGLYVVSFSDDLDMQIVRVGEDGLVIDAMPIVLAADVNCSHARVASSGTDFLLTCDADGGATEDDILALRLEPNGTSPDPSPVVLAGVADDQFDPRPSWNGSSWTVTWRDTRGPSTSTLEVYVQLFDLDLSPLTAASPVVTLSDGWHAVDTTGGQTLVVYESARADILGRRVDDAGVFLDADPFEISRGYNRQLEPAAAYGAGMYLVAWYDSRPGSQHAIYASRVGSDGVPIDDPPILVREPLATGRVDAPALSFDGTDFFVVWPEEVDVGASRELYGARVGVDGTVVDTSPLQLTSSLDFENDPAMVFDGSAHMVVFLKNGDTHAFRVLPNGTRLDASDIFLSTEYALPLQVVRGAGRFYATPHQFLVGSTPGALSVQNSFAGANEDFHSVATSGDAYLLITSDNSPIGLWATLFDASGAFANHVRIEYANPYEAQAAWFGDHYYLVYVDSNGMGGNALHGVEIDLEGNPVGSPELLDSGGSIAFDYLRLTVGDSGTALLSYTRHDDALGVERLYVRLLQEDLLSDGAACLASAECQSGFCVDGVCCDAACGGGSVADCLACSTAAGALANGTCGTASMGTPCRPSAGLCDVAESCDGSNSACPPDFLAADGTPCDLDSDVCDGTDMCATGSCVAGAVPDCDDLDLCTADACDAVLECVHTPLVGCCNLDLECTDGDLCTADACSGPGGVCSFTPIVGCCNLDVDCADGDACTADSCPTPGGACVHVPIPDCCASDDDCAAPNACTATTCDLGTNTCSLTPLTECCLTDLDCDDGDACTVDDCPAVGASCASTPIPGCCNLDAECDDGDVCTADSCPTAGGVCLNEEIADCCRETLDCDDGDACTLDDCDPITGACSHDRDPLCDVPPPKSGCSCTAAGAGPSHAGGALATLPLLGLFVYARRRRRQA